METQTLDIDTLDAGRELDAMVAERVMGWRWLNYRWHDGTSKQLLWPSDADEQPRGDDFDRLYDGRLVPWDINYSTDIAAAWQVVEHFHEQRGWFVSIQSDGGWNFHNNGTTKGWEVTIGREGEAFAPTLPLALCRAALKAVAATSQSPASTP
jgi:hypothetical protein